MCLNIDCPTNASKLNENRNRKIKGLGGIRNSIEKII
jgi:hypothetical protein